MSSLFITQTVASAIAALEVNRWVLMLIINVFLLIAGMFLPPVAVIVMATPLLLPIVTQAGFDPYWFAVILTINMEIGLITPPIGLNLFVINAIAPNVPTRDVLWGALPYVLVMMLAIGYSLHFPGHCDLVPGISHGTGDLTGQLIARHSDAAIRRILCLQRNLMTVRLRCRMVR